MVKFYSADKFTYVKDEGCFIFYTPGLNRQSDSHLLEELLPSKELRQWWDLNRLQLDVAEVFASLYRKELSLLHSKLCLLETLQDLSFLDFDIIFVFENDSYYKVCRNVLWDELTHRDLECEQV